MPLLMVVLAVWLGWQVLLQPITERAPPGLGLKVAPGSPRLLARAAEGELAAGRTENATALARASLIRTVFNVRALRIIGLAMAQDGQRAQANELLTLAGNWSLRDDPSHAWLVEYRLSRGDYVSAFAHADTLARRREDRQDSIFRLFTAAAEQDPRSLPALTGLLARDPPWRSNYINSLYYSEAGHRIAATIAIALSESTKPFTREEQGVLYRQLVSRGWIGVISQVRSVIGPPAGLMNGAFNPLAAAPPFEWALFGAAGVSAEILPDDIRADSALRVQYESFSAKPVAEQFLQLAPGRYRISGQMREETGSVDSRLVWNISCFESGTTVGILLPPKGPAVRTWRTLSADFVIPAQGCTGQWLRLEARPGNDRTLVTVWYDRFAISTEG
jgi:hypothetical protein